MAKKTRMYLGGVPADIGRPGRQGVGNSQMNSGTGSVARRLIQPNHAQRACVVGELSNRHRRHQRGV